MRTLASMRSIPLGVLVGNETSYSQGASFRPRCGILFFSLSTSTSLSLFAGIWSANSFIKSSEGSEAGRIGSMLADYVPGPSSVCSSAGQHYRYCVHMLRHGQRSGSIL